MSALTSSAGSPLTLESLINLIKSLSEVPVIRGRRDESAFGCTESTKTKRSAIRQSSAPILTSVS